MDSRSHLLLTRLYYKRKCKRHPSGSLTFTLRHLSLWKSIMVWLISIRKSEMSCRLSTVSWCPWTSQSPQLTSSVPCPQACHSWTDHWRRPLRRKWGSLFVANQKYISAVKVWRVRSVLITLCQKCSLHETKSWRTFQVFRAWLWCLMTQWCALCPSAQWSSPQTPTTFLLLLLRSVTQKSLCNCSNVHLFYWQAYSEISGSASVSGYRNLTAKAMEMNWAWGPKHETSLLQWTVPLVWSGKGRPAGRPLSRSQMAGGP